MNVVQSQQLGQHSDLATRAYNTYVNAPKPGPAFPLEEAAPVKVSVAELEATGLAPSAYTVLVSRLENRGGSDTSAIVELTDWIDSRMPHLSDQARRRIAALPEYAAAGLKPEAGALGPQIAVRLGQDGVTDSMLAFLKHPLFTAYMKDQQVRTTVYGPRGLLRAS